MFVSGPNMKCDKRHPNAPSPPSSPVKKKTRISTVATDEIIQFPPPRFLSPITTSPPQLFSPVDSASYDNTTSPSPTTDNDAPDSALVTVQSSRKASKNKGLLTSYWKVATSDQKAEMVSREFQKLRDNHEQYIEEHAHQERLRKSRVRALARECQQKHRDRSRERKITNNWVPGQKHVRFPHINIFHFTDN